MISELLELCDKNKIVFVANGDRSSPGKYQKRFPVRIKQPLDVPNTPGRLWSMDFMHDSLHYGKRFRTLNVFDEGVREALAIEIDTPLPTERLIRVLERLKEIRGLPCR